MNKYIAAIYKTGEKRMGMFNTRGRKPVGFIRYIEPWKGSLVAWEYIKNKWNSYQPEDEPTPLKPTSKIWKTKRIKL